MGFFSDLKEDLSQAVNELLPEDAMEETAEIPESSQEESAAFSNEMTLENVNLSDMLDKMEAMNLEMEADSQTGSAGEALQEEPVEEEPASEEPEPEEPAVPEQEEFDMGEPIAEESVIEESIMEESVMEESVMDESILEDSEPEEASEPEELSEPSESEEPSEQEAPSEPEEQTEETVIAEDHNDEVEEKSMADNKEFEMEEKRVASDETALITLGMTIRGDVDTEGSLDLIGKVIGNVDVLGKLNITGTVEGNSKASEIYAEKAHIIGEVRSEGALKIGQNSVIIGNVYGNAAVVAGAIKGDIDVKGPVVLDSTAIVMGNIKSKSVQINNGAVIEGMCSQCYADVTPTSFFDDFKLD